MQDLLAPVKRVTLLEDRAYVARLGQAEVPAGLSRWRVAEVSSVLVDKTLVAQLQCQADCGARLISARVERHQVTPPPPPPESRQELEQRARLLSRLDVRKGLLKRELEGARRLISQFLQEISLDAAWGRCQRTELESRLEELEAWKQRLLDAQLEVEVEIAKQAVAPKPLLESAERPTRLQADLVVEIDSDQPQRVDFTLEYSVPGACWRPYHTAILDGDGSFEFRSDGCVWQNTGEEWDQVELFFSTQRPSLGADPPPLPADVLRTQKKSQETVVVARDQEIHELAVDELERPVRRQTAVEVPGIDDGGEALNLRGLTLARVPCNGQPVRVEMFSFRGQVELERVLMAEICPAVIVKSTHKNDSNFPLLAGPVDLIREAGAGGAVGTSCGLVGRASTLFVAPGETFSLGWGPDPHLRAQRHASQDAEEKDDLLGGWRRTPHNVHVKLSNLGLQPRSLRVIERVPLSEVKQVEIIPDSKITTDGLSPDTNGFVTWTVELGPRGRHELHLAYAVRRRKEVVGL